jgi:ABC-type glycerol-3-phosphate transport system substrate-binding protein
MQITKAFAVPAVILASGLVLAGCGDTEPAAEPSPSESAMMEDDKMEEDKMMSPSPSEDAMMEEEDDKMEEDG